MHAGVYLVAGAVQKTSVDKDQALARCTNTLFEVHCGASFLVHDANLQGITIKA